MPSWILKAAIQGTLCHLPQPQRWNGWFQRRFTGSLDLTPSYFLDKWKQCELHLQVIKAQGKIDPVVLELGTGWFQVSAIGFALRGAKKVYTIDRQSLIDNGRVKVTLHMFRKLIDDGLITSITSRDYDRLSAVIQQLPRLSAVDALRELNVNAIVTDAQNITLPNGSIDMFTSNNTLEHIPEQVLEGIFREFARLCAAQGTMSHYIDLSDHYSHFDKSLSPLHFLRFTESQWRWFNNDLHFQNRLRVHDFRAIHQRTGWNISQEKNESDGVESLHSIVLADMFQHAEPADVAVYRSWMVSQLADSAPTLR
jgi:hypothetical protein